jgi:hypothetical protein
MATRGAPEPRNPNVENRWWVETTVKRKRNQAARPGEAGPQGDKPEAELPQLPVAMGFYEAARGYDQERAKEDLTDNNLRIAREANPEPGAWVHVEMTPEHYPPKLVQRIKDEFRLPREARGVLLDHGRLVRLLVCGPQLEDWMIDVTLGEEPSVDVYVWGTMWRERLFRRAEDALKQARRWALNLVQHPPERDDPFRGVLL